MPVGTQGSEAALWNALKYRTVAALSIDSIFFWWYDINITEIRSQILQKFILKRR